MPASTFLSRRQADLAEMTDLVADLTDLTAWDRDTRFLRAVAAASGLKTPSGSSRLDTTA